VSDDSEDPAFAISEVMLEQVERQGAASVRVSDGHVFVFSTTMLETLLARSFENEDGLVMVFVKRGAEA
jgi:hypothetical protein